MKRTRTVGVAVAMALALASLVGAASASAAIFEVPGAGAKSSTTWNGALTSKNHVLALGANESFTCSKVAFTGEMPGQSTAALTVSPELGGCSWLSQSVTWAMNGCKYRFNVGAGGKNPETGTVDIVGCETEMIMAVSGNACVVRIGNQSNIGTVTYTSTEVEGLRSVNVAAKLTGIKYTRSGPSCPGIPGTFSDGTYTGEWTVRPAHFVTTSAPANLQGTLTSQGPKIFNFGTQGVISCNKFEATGSMASVSAEAITLAPTLIGECSSGTQTMGMGGCSFRYTGSGDFQIVGATCASNPLTVKPTAPGGCTFSVGPQIPSSSVALVNQGEGGTRTVLMANGGAIGGIEYTATGSGCAKPGTWSDGEYKQRLVFSSRTQNGGQQALSVE